MFAKLFTFVGVCVLWAASLVVAATATAWFCIRPEVPLRPVAVLLAVTGGEGYRVDAGRVVAPAEGRAQWAPREGGIELTFPFASRPSVEARVPILGVKRGFVEKVLVTEDEIRFDIDGLPNLSFPVVR